MKISFAELSRQYDKYKLEYEDAALRALRSGWYILGGEVARFENDFAKYEGVKHCIGVGNGLDALRLGLSGLGIGAGDEVIVQDNTFIATALAITENGATPVFVDADAYFGIDTSAIEEAITPKTKAIIVVHLYGQACDMDSIMKIANAHNLYVVEDCAQSHGATYHGKLTGTFGDIGCFSFYPTKPVGALGDAGAIITNNDAVAEKVRMLHNYGSRVKYKHELLGINSRMDEIQAAVLGVGLHHIKDGNDERCRIAQMYTDGIHNPQVQLPMHRKDCEHVYHVYAIRCEERELLLGYLSKKGIQAQIHYPIPCHLAECYRNMGYKRGDFPVSEQISTEELSLPIYVGLTETEVTYIIDAMNAF